jgi:hypothetical protein
MSYLCPITKFDFIVCLVVVQSISQPRVPLHAALQTNDFDLIRAVVGSKTVIDLLQGKRRVNWMGPAIIKLNIYLLYWYFQQTQCLLFFYRPSNPTSLSNFSKAPMGDSLKNCLHSVPLHAALQTNDFDLIRAVVVSKTVIDLLQGKRRVNWVGPAIWSSSWNSQPNNTPIRNLTANKYHNIPRLP